MPRVNLFSALRPVGRQTKPASDRQVKTGPFEKGNIRPGSLQQRSLWKVAENGECPQRWRSPSRYFRCMRSVGRSGGLLVNWESTAVRSGNTCGRGYPGQTPPTTCRRQPATRPPRFGESSASMPGGYRHGTRRFAGLHTSMFPPPHAGWAPLARACFRQSRMLPFSASVWVAGCKGG